MVRTQMAVAAEQARAFPEILALEGGAALAEYEIAPGLGAFSAYSRRRAQVVRETLGRALRAPGGEALAAVLGDTIIGYLLLVPAGIDQPWGRLGDPRVLEVGIEVARGHRGAGIAQSLFRRAFARPEVESRIYVATGYVWCWDIEDTVIEAGIYADRLLALFGRFGFRREWTNEPNVALEPLNFLAVRIGRDVPAALVNRFRLAQRGEQVA